MGLQKIHYVDVYTTLNLDVRILSPWKIRDTSECNTFLFENARTCTGVLLTAFNRASSKSDVV